MEDREFVCFTVVMRTEHAWALAQFLKRAGFDDYLRLAVDEGEAYQMRAAGETLRAELANAGYEPR